MSEALKKILTAAVRVVNKENEIKLVKVEQFGDEDRGAGVYRDAQYSEYRVITIGDGAHLKNADYHTSDLQDALDTAEAITLKLKSPESLSTHEHEAQPVAAENEGARPLPTRPRGYYEQPSSLLSKLLGRAL